MTILTKSKIISIARVLTAVTALGLAIYMMTIPDYPEQQRTPVEVSQLEEMVTSHPVDEIHTASQGYEVHYYTGPNNKDVTIFYDSDGGFDGRRGVNHSDLSLPLILGESVFIDAENPGPHVRIFHDLEPGDRGIAHVIEYEGISPHNSFRYDLRYVEIHIPRDQPLEPGLETLNRGPIQYEEPVHRIFPPET